MFNKMKPSEFVNAARQIFTINRELNDTEIQYNEDVNLLQDMMEYVDDKKFSSNTPLGMLGEALNALDDVDADSEYDALLYFDSIYEYLNDISSLNLDGNDDEWVMQGNLTSNLQNLFGLDRITNNNIDVNIANDWVPPKSFGLENSEPIIKTDRNIAPSKSIGYNDQYDKISSKYNDNYDFKADSKSTNSGISNSYNNNISFAADSKSISTNSFTNSYKFEEKINNPQYNDDNDNEEEDDEDDDDDDDEDFDYDYDNDDNIANLNMSANLMAALGLDTSKVDVATDWKPPAQAGLDNSTRIV